MPISLQLLLKGQMKFMQQQGFEVCMVSSDGKELSALKMQEGCEHVIVPFTRKITPIQDLICLIQLIRLFRHRRPDIVHTHTPKAGLLGMLAAKLSGVPIRLHTIGGLPWMESEGLLRRLLKGMEKLTAAAAHRVYPNSFLLQRFLIAEKFPVDKFRVLGEGSTNGIDCNFFSCTEEVLAQAAQLRKVEDVPEQAFVWIFIGRVVKDKGIAELLESFQVIHTQFPEDQLWIVGDEEQALDPLSTNDSHLLQTHKAIRRFAFTADIRPHLAAAQVLTFPSYREGFPNVPMQAGAMGCALLLSDINGCNEIVANGVDGLLVPPKSSAALIEAMLQLRNDAPKRTIFAQAIRQKIVARYERQKIWNLLQQEYQYFLAQKNIQY